MRSPCAAALLALCAAVAPLQAAEPALDTTLSLRADGWTGNRQLDDGGGLARGSAWARARLSLGEAGKLQAEGWLAAQTHGGADRSRLRELYWQGSLGALDIKLGRKIVAWGRADGLNPTDNLSPRDFTLLVPSDDEQRRGNDGLQLSTDVGIGTLNALWMVRAASHTLPLEALPQVGYAVQRASRRSQWALKLDLTGEGIDGSLSAFVGDDPMPDVSLQGLGASGLQVGVRNNRLRVLGADLSLTRGSTVWRAEAAWMQTDSRGPDDFQRKKPRLWLVAGAEWPLVDSLTLGLQATLQQVRDFRSPDTLANPFERQIAWRQAAIANQTAAHQTGLVWRLAGRWLNDALTAECNGVMLNNPHSLLVRTRLAWSINDRLQLQAGTDHHRGPQHSLWGQLQRNRVAFVQLRFTV